jgi:SAM-dependent methyltransferase
MAWFMARGCGRYETLVGSRKRRLLGNLTGLVVELGSGTGTNLRHLPADLRFVGTEPNPFMHGHFVEEARSVTSPALLVRARAEALPFPDGSVDAVLSTLVLCSVGRLGPVLDEVLRVLKTGGKFIFVEHVAAPEGSRLRRLQSLVRPVWRRVGDGCEPDRDMEEDLRRAGFEDVRLDRFDLPIPIVSPHIAGFATK